MTAPSIPSTPITPPRGRFRLGRCTSPEALTAALSCHILGQPEAIKSVVRALTIAAAGLHDADRPIASLFFAGPTGVGKTELVRRIAAEITGDPDGLCRIDMNSLAQEHYAASLAGAPPGYAGSKEQYTLFDRELIEGNPSRPGIVLFDEVEKAHTTVIRSLLQILDTGVLHLSSGNGTISFRNSIIIFTSNLGSAEVAENQRTATEGTEDSEDTDPIRAAVERFFDPELFNRFDEVVRFQSLGHSTSRQIVTMELTRLRDRLQAQNISWTPTEEILESITNEGFDTVYGARNLRRTLRTALYAPIAARIIGLPSTGNHTMTTTLDETGRIHATVTTSAAE